ncbi:MAG: prolipoprotein diacylglyceryl transferase [Myxococcales bacterium]|nr:prolipoprotein diacylglyceryl transferase [Myxococcales bacterium]
MHPVLLQLRIGENDLALRAYGVLIAVGFVSGLLLCTREARRTGHDPDRIRDLFFYLLVAALAGARLLYVVTNVAEFRRVCAEGDASRTPWRLILDCSRPLHVWEGGLVFYGGLAGALLAGLFYTRRHGMSFFASADLVTPSLAIGHAIGRIGCFLAGCCFGRPTGSPLAVHFPPEALAFQEMVARGLLPASAGCTPGLHPTQLYEAAGELAIFVLLVVVQRRKRPAGHLFVLWMGLYALLRAAIEIFRGDQARRYVIELATPALDGILGLDPGSASFLSTSQAGSLLAFAIALLAWRRLAGTRA